MPKATAEHQSASHTETFEHVVQILEGSHADLKQNLAGLSDDFCSRKAADDGWSITEVVEHLVMIERRVPRLLHAKLPDQEITPDAPNLRERDAALVEQIASYTSKIEAPDAVKPVGQYQSCRRALDDFSAARQHTLNYATSAKQYLHGRLLPHPLLGPIDGYQWLLALAAHTQRHVTQIQRMIATAN